MVVVVLVEGEEPGQGLIEESWWVDLEVCMASLKSISHSNILQNQRRSTLKGDSSWIALDCGKGLDTPRHIQLVSPAEDGDIVCCHDTKQRQAQLIHTSQHEKMKGLPKNAPSCNSFC